MGSCHGIQQISSLSPSGGQNLWSQAGLDAFHTRLDQLLCPPSMHGGAIPTRGRRQHSHAALRNSADAPTVKRKIHVETTRLITSQTCWELSSQCACGGSLGHWANVKQNENDSVHSFRSSPTGAAQNLQFISAMQFDIRVQHVPLARQSAHPKHPPYHNVRLTLDQKND
eukprot:6484061-Amphidinium_carterae.1